MELDLELYPYVATESASFHWLTTVVITSCILFVAIGLFIGVRRYNAPRARFNRSCRRLISAIANTDNPALYLDTLSSLVRNYIQIENICDARESLTDQEIITLLVADPISAHASLIGHMKALEAMRFGARPVDKNQLLRILKSIAVI